MKKTKRRSVAVPKKTIRLPKKAGIPLVKLMSVYRSHVKELHSRTKPVTISQTTQTIGTDNSWFNAQIIPTASSWVPVTNTNYVWYSGDLTRDNAIISKTFQISGRISSATLFLSVDNYATVIINGVPLVFDGPTSGASNYNPGRTFTITRFLRRGRNDIVIIAFNYGGARSASNPAGVAARLDISLS